MRAAFSVQLGRTKLGELGLAELAKVPTVPGGPDERCCAWAVAVRLARDRDSGGPNVDDIGGVVDGKIMVFWVPT